MGWTMKIGEVLRALAVLTLFCFNFAHTPLAAAPADAYAAPTHAGFCGDPVEDKRGQANAPCHACRIGGGADLPPPCPLAMPAFADGAAIDYHAIVLQAPRTADRPAATARGPPPA
jgi:hypothetical protein